MTSAWRLEDGGPRRLQCVAGGLFLSGGDGLSVTSRIAPVSTMVVGDGARLLLLRHTAGPDAVSHVEHIDATTLQPLATSPSLAGGPVWPGGLGIVDDDGSTVVVFGNHAHRLDASLAMVASCELPRPRPYNGFVPLPDGHLVTKDFAGSLPGHPVPASAREPSELVVLSPDDLSIVDRLVVPEPSIARLSADGATVYVVGDTSLLRATWTGQALELDDSFVARYRTMPGQTCGWDCVIAAGHAWFLDDGDGTEAFAGTLHGVGTSSAPLHLVRVDLSRGDVAMVEVCGKPGGVIANPPVVDVDRGVVVAYDSGNGEVAAFDAASLDLRWRRQQDHASHLLLHSDTGELVTGDGPDVVVLDVATGAELGRADSGLGMQSVLFPCPGPVGSRTFYVCALSGVCRVEVAGAV